MTTGTDVIKQTQIFLTNTISADGSPPLSGTEANQHTKISLTLTIDGAFPLPGTEVKKQPQLSLPTTMTAKDNSPLSCTEANEQTQSPWTPTPTTNKDLIPWSSPLLVYRCSFLTPNNVVHDHLTHVKQLCELHNIKPITEKEEFVGGKWYYFITFGDEALGYASHVERHKAKEGAAKLAHESVDSLLTAQ